MTGYFERVSTYDTYIALQVIHVSSIARSFSLTHAMSLEFKTKNTTSPLLDTR